MKTSDEWAKQFKLHSCVGNKKFEAQIKQIQRDAFEAGMSEVYKISLSACVNKNKKVDDYIERFEK